MATFTMTFTTDNDAFEGEGHRDYAIARILHDQFKASKHGIHNRVLTDINGNTIGETTFTEEN
jgi:hypothetical protein